MKKLLLSMLMLFTLTAIAQNQTVTYVFDKASKSVEKVYSDGTKVVQKGYEVATKLAPKIEDALKTLGSSLKVGANNLWDLLVKQQLVWSICFLILTLASITNWSMFYIRYLNNTRNKGSLVEKIQKTYRAGYNGKEEYCTGNIKTQEYVLTIPNGWFMWLHLIICLILSYFSFIHFTDMLTGFLNPEFGAVKTIVDIASQIK